MSSYVGRTSVFEGSNRIGGNTKFFGYIGYGSYIGENCRISAKIGKFTSIASDVKTLSGKHPSSIFVSTSPAFYSLQKTNGLTFTSKQRFEEYKKADKDYDVIIGNDVWIGLGVSILGGVTIGDGAIIAANATVTRDVQPYTIVGGLPAKKIGQRFTEDKIEYLLKVEWWNKPIEWIKEKADSFENIDEFIKQQ
ncbi:CatB-related O-acetyltransferase [Clostridium gasigenes]|nr:CatB-related O-acetyltransferase [Clostridium gasigenes]